MLNRCIPHIYIMTKKCPLYGMAIYMDCLECEEKVCTKMVDNTKKYKKAVIGIDQSYTNTGISIALDGKLKVVTSTDYFKECPCKHKNEEQINSNGKIVKVGKPSKTEKRAFVREKVKNALELCTKNAEETIVIVERIRTFNQGQNNFAKYMKPTAALIATIVDVAFEYDVKVYSVDTRTWKKAIVGDVKKGGNKFGVDPNKWHTICYVVKELGFKQVMYRNKNNRLCFDDDMADSACIALYGFNKKQTLSLEE